MLKLTNSLDEPDGVLKKRRQRSMSVLPNEAIKYSTQDKRQSKSKSSPHLLKRGRAFSNTKRFVGNVEVDLLNDDEEEHDEPDQEIHHYFWRRAMKSVDNPHDDAITIADTTPLRHNKSMPHLLSSRSLSEMDIKDWMSSDNLQRQSLQSRLTCDSSFCRMIDPNHLRTESEYQMRIWNLRPRNLNQDHPQPRPTMKKIKVW